MTIKIVSDSIEIYEAKFRFIQATNYLLNSEKAQEILSKCIIQQDLYAINVTDFGPNGWRHNPADKTHYINWRYEMCQLGESNRNGLIDIHEIELFYKFDEKKVNKAYSPALLLSALLDLAKAPSNARMLELKQLPYELKPSVICIAEQLNRCGFKEGISENYLVCKNNRRCV